MKDPQGRLLRRVVAGITLAALAGCAGEPRQARPLLASSGGPIALVAARFEPATDFNLYARGKGASAAALGAGGAAEGAALGAVAPLGMPFGTLLYPVLAPITIIAGAIVGGAVGAGIGSAHGLSEAEARTVRRLADEALASRDPQEAAARSVRQAAAEAGLPLVREAGAPGLGPRAPDDFPDYRALLGAPYAGVLETAVMSLRFVGREARRGRLYMEVTLRARGVERDGAMAIELEHRSRALPVEQWAEKNGERVERELESAHRALARKLVVRLRGVEPALQDPGAERFQ